MRTQIFTRLEQSIYCFFFSLVVIFVLLLLFYVKIDRYYILGEQGRGNKDYK